MGTESERCVDELLAKQALVEQLLDKYNQLKDQDANKNNDEEARNVLASTQAFIDNNRSIIPAYCLKKVTDALRKLESYLDKPKKSKFQFKFKANDSPVATQKRLEEDKEISSDKEVAAVMTEALGFRNEIQQVLRLDGDKVDSKDVSLVNLDQCQVMIYGHANTVYIRDLTGSTVTVFLACRAITVTNCKDCHFRLACQQLRIDSTISSKFEIFTSARSMLESSKELEFSRLNLNKLSEDDIKPEETKQLLKRAKFDESQNNWKCIDDFDWLSPNTVSKNFKIIES